MATKKITKREREEFERFLADNDLDPKFDPWRDPDDDELLWWIVESNLREGDGGVVTVAARRENGSLRFEPLAR